ncbi:MAG TPA: autotransporter-associated beta strand repeat-containing protein [Chthoniobacterales bacterium]
MSTTFPGSPPPNRTKTENHLQATLGFAKREICRTISAGLAILAVSLRLVCGDTLQWDPSGSSTSFTSANWHDVTTGSGGLIGPGGTSDYNTLQFVGSGNNSKDAPTAMSVGASTSFTSLLFADSFNSTNTTAISNNTAANYIFHIANNGSIADNATSGTITFSRSSSGTFTFDLYGANAVTVAAGAQIVFDSTVVIANESSTNIGGIAKTGGGTLTLAGANTFSGATAVSGGVLNAAGTGSNQALAATTSVTVNSSGTLLLGNSNQINDSATMTLNGGSFNTGGFSEHGGSNNAAGVGSLTLSSSSVLNLGNGSSILAFAKSSGQSWTGTLSIYNWSGSTTGGGTDQVYFGTDNTGLTSTQLSQIEFYTGNGTGDLGMARILADGEIVPVPEPATWLAGILSIAAIAWSLRGRFSQRLLLD